MQLRKRSFLLALQNEVCVMRKKNPDTMSAIKSFAEDFMMTNGRMPTTAEFSDAVGVARGTVYKYLVEMTEKGMLDYDGKSLSVGKINRSDMAVIRAGIYGSIPCGVPEQEEEQLESVVQLPVSIFGAGELYILRADGDSMTGADICDGDLVVIRKTGEAKPGDIVVALDEEYANTLKTLRFDSSSGRYFLHPENDEYDDIYPSEISVQGVATHIIKSVRNMDIKKI